MQNVWLHFKACLNFAHTLVARIVSSFLPVFFLLSSFLSCKGFFPHLLSHFSPSVCEVRSRSDRQSWPFFRQPKINTLNRLITPSDKLGAEAFCRAQAHTTLEATGFPLTAVCGRGWGSVSLCLEIADMSDVSSTLRVRTPWAARVAEACTWPKWANPLHVSPQTVSRELQGFPLKLYRCLHWAAKTPLPHWRLAYLFLHPG